MLNAMKHLGNTYRGVNVIFRFTKNDNTIFN